MLADGGTVLPKDPRRLWQQHLEQYSMTQQHMRGLRVPADSQQAVWWLAAAKHEDCVATEVS